MFKDAHLSLPVKKAFIGMSILLMVLAGARPNAFGLFTASAAQEWNADAIGQAIDAWLRETKTPGVVVGISFPNQADVLISRGVSDMKQQTALKVTDEFKVGSVTKTFIAAETLKLVAATRLALDDPVAKFLPDTPHGDKVTIRDLLSHRSGYFDPIYDDPSFISTVGQQLDRHWTWSEVLTTTFKHTLYFEPGTQFRYSNANYLLLGLIIEHLTGHSLGVVLTADIMTPLHLDHTWYATPDSNLNDHTLIHGYDTFFVKGSDLLDITGIPKTALLTVTTDNIVSDASDLLRWARLLYGQNPTLLPTTLQSQMVTFDEGRPYGFGVYRYDTSIGLAVGHGGISPGYQSLVVFFPTQDMALTILVNADSDASNPNTLLSTVLGLLFPNLANGEINHLIADLTNPDPQVRNTAINALGHRGEPARKAVPQLIVVLQSDSVVANRRDAALALGILGIGSPEAKSALQNALKDNDDSVRKAVQVALRVLG